jgi:hypothetical protein
MLRSLRVPLCVVALALMMAGCSGSGDLPTVPSAPPPGTVKEGPVEKVDLNAGALKKLKAPSAKAAAKSGAGAAASN